MLRKEVKILLGSKIINKIISYGKQNKGLFRKGVLSRFLNRGWGG
jgi:hypothetical protein